MKRARPALRATPPAKLDHAELLVADQPIRKQPGRKPMTAASYHARLAPWHYIVGALAGALVLVWAYAPALHGSFLFDDNALALSQFGTSDSVKAWIAGVRPVLMFTYWINRRVFGEDPYSYHVLNLMIHGVTSGLVFLIVRRILAWSDIADLRRGALAGFAALLFLLHPVQTESVAYIAGRSEALSDGLALAAFVVFLRRREAAIAWLRAAIVLALFAAALLAKEQTIVLPALLLLTDWYWNPGFRFDGIRNNWRLYLPMAAGALWGITFFWKLITQATSAGFGLKEFTWYQYFFTECRALFVYMSEFLLPIRLNADWDFPISKTITEHGSIAAVGALLASAGLAWHYRRRFRLASYGYFVFLLAMAPTSSIVPILDPVAERRLYFGMLGLLLILIDLASRLSIGPRALTAAGLLLLVVSAGATHGRAEVWSGAVPLWEDTVSKSPGKWRAHFQLANAYYNDGRCGPAESEFRKTAQMEPPAYDLLVGWGLAYDCLNRPEEALEKLRQAAALHAMAHVYSQIGMVYAKRARWPEALDALAAAEKLDPGFFMTYYYRGGVHLATKQNEAAIRDYDRALALRPGFEPALQGLAIARSRQAGR